MAEWIIEANDTEEAAEGEFAFVRELVRCEECKHRDGIDGQCPVQSTGDPFYDYKPDDNWYCGDGERREWG